jgi:Bromodomain/HMG (high mobility group) box
MLNRIKKTTMVCHFCYGHVFDVYSQISATEEELEWPDEVDFHDLPVDFLRKVLKKEDPFYPYVEGCDNPYRDGYATEPPKKPRASYLFFQCTMRQYFIRKYADYSQTELMAKMGETWRGLDDESRLCFQILADEESAEYERQKILLDKAQKPNGVWQPIRRCKMVLDRLANDSFADIFLEPVDLEEFPDYQDAVEVMMDLRTVRERLETKKYQVPEQFARDMRRVRWAVCNL